MEYNPRERWRSFLLAFALTLLLLALIMVGTQKTAPALSWIVFHLIPSGHIIQSKHFKATTCIEAVDKSRTSLLTMT